MKDPLTQFPANLKYFYRDISKTYHVSDVVSYIVGDVSVAYRVDIRGDIEWETISVAEWHSQLADMSQWVEDYGHDALAGFFGITLPIKDKLRKDLRARSSEISWIF